MIWESHRSMSTHLVHQNWIVSRCLLANGPNKICNKKNTFVPFHNLNDFVIRNFVGKSESTTYRSAPKPPSVMLISNAVVHLYPCVQLHFNCFWNERLPRHKRSDCTEQFDLKMIELISSSFVRDVLNWICSLYSHIILFGRIATIF